MARVRSGNTGFAVALVIFGSGFVISLLVAVIFYTKIETHKSAEQQAKKDLAQFITSVQTTQAKDYQSSDASVFLNMLNQIRAHEQNLGKANERIAELTHETSQMDGRARTLVEQKEEIEDQLEVEAEYYRETMEQSKASLEDALLTNTELQEQITDIQNQLNQAMESADAAARNRINELTNQLQATEGHVAEATRQTEAWKRKYNTLLAGLPTPPPLDTTNPDGQVASVFGKGNDLFINLGRRDGLVIGMTFEIFDPQPVIRLSTEGEARGKATVEVYGLEEKSAICRVVRRNRTININPGDPIVNLGYDPNMTINMLAFGDFDIDRDGGTNDLGQIEAIIQSSGAKLIEIARGENNIPVLTPDINYVILGMKPEIPDKPSDDDFDSVKDAEYRAKLAANDAYFRILDEAKQLRIPVLSQDRFLELVGYYEQ